MRGLPNSALAETASSGGPAPSTVGRAEPMRYDHFRADKHVGARPSGIVFDSKQRLRGEYDHVHFDSGHMADTYEPAAGGEDR